MFETGQPAGHGKECRFKTLKACQRLAKLILKRKERNIAKSVHDIKTWQSAMMQLFFGFWVN